MDAERSKKLDEDLSTEEKILVAAMNVFIDKGYDGARMQEIAGVAGINKALLHYYFRSKEKLFLAVFETAMNSLLPSLIQTFLNDKPMAEKIHDFFDLHMGYLIENPGLPSFIVFELSRHSEMLHAFITKLGELELYSKFEDLVNERIELGEIKKLEPVQLLLNMLSISIFPILASPMIMGVLNLTKEEYNVILAERKVLAAESVIDSIIA